MAVPTIRRVLDGCANH